MSLEVTALYAALLALVGLVLTGLVGRARSRTTISLGDGGDPRLIEAMRRHANWVETVPIALILIAIAEINGAPDAWIHGLGGVLLAARLIHPFGINATDMRTIPRFVGMLGTMLAEVAAIGLVLWQVVMG